MSVMLDVQDIALTRELVDLALQNKFGRVESHSESLSFGGDMLAFLIEQVTIPLVVSLCASVLYDVLKGKALGMMQKHEAEKALNEMLGKELKPAPVLPQECLKALEDQLVPLGFSRDDIVALYQDLVLHLEQKQISRTILTGVEDQMPKITILFLAANPIDTPVLKLDEEVRAIDQALRLSRYRDYFLLEQHWALRLEDLQEILLRCRPVIVHFSGHGTDTNRLMLKDNTGRGYALLPGTLDDLFSLLRENIRCVVLNACYSKRQAEAIACHVDCVVGMSRSIHDLAAMRFSSAFYQALGYGKDIKTAFKLGRLNIEAAGDRRMPRLMAMRCNPSEVILVNSGGT